MATIKFEEFIFGSGDWETYIDRFSFFLEANDITDIGKQRAIFYSSCGSNLFELVKSLIVPKNPHQVPLAEVLIVLNNHFSPRPNEIVESYKFHTRNQKTNECMQEYIATLRKLSRFCNFSDLERTLRDRLVCGVQDKNLQDNLLKKSNLTYKTAVEMALESEARAKHLKLIQYVPSSEVPSTTMENTSEPMDINVVKEENKKILCYRCGGSHLYHKCKYIAVKCRLCNKIGHFARMCRQKESSVKNIMEQEVKPANKLNGLFSINDNRNRVPPVSIKVYINRVPMNFEIDSGSTYTIVSENQAQRIWNNKMPVFGKCKINLQTWTCNKVELLGSIQVLVEYKDFRGNLDLLIAKGSGHSLLGRNWFQALGIKIDGINMITDNTVLKKLEKYKNVFTKKLGVYKGPQVKVHIRDDAAPVFFRCRPVPFAIRDRVCEEIDRLVKNDIIEPIPYSNWATPIVPVTKADGRIRLCGDYRLTVNSVTETDTYPQPTINEALSELAGGQIFTKLDLKEAYTQVSVCDETAHLLTITTPKGLYKVKRLPYGLKASPGIFQRLMSTTLAGIAGVSVLLDDILIAGANQSQHDDRLEEVLKRLLNVGLTLNIEKCSYSTDKVEFLGYVVDHQGIHPASKKVDAIYNAKPPKNIKELQAFLGLLNFYERFIPNKATILEPLHRLLDKGIKWKWEKKEEEAFYKARTALTCDKTLIHFDNKRSVTLTCDASEYGVGAVLSHIMDDGTERPILMGSRTLNKHERLYAQIDKEAAAIMFGLEKFHQYVYGRHIDIYTDHKPLLGIFSSNKAIPKVLSPRMMRWALKLNSYDYNLMYKSGDSIGNADALSRWPIETSNDNEIGIDADSILLLSETPSAMQYSSKDIAEYTSKDHIMSKVKFWILHGWPDTIENEVAKVYWLKRNELSLCNDCIIWGNRVIIPPPLREYMLESLHETHDGIVISKGIARSYFWWPGLDHEIEAMVNRCEICQATRNMPQSTSHSWVTPTNAWQRLHVDFAGPYHNKIFFIVVDAHSKWPEVKLVSTTSSKCAINALRDIFSGQGLPEVIVSDNGTAFTSLEFKIFLKNNGIRHILTPPYTPSCNGQAERTVQTVKNKLQKSNATDYTVVLPRLLFGLRTTPNTVTGKTPAEVLNKRRFRTRFDFVHPYSAKTKSEQIIEKNMEVNIRTFMIKDKVWLRNYSGREKWSKGTIVKIKGPVRFLVKMIDGPIVTRHINQLRKREVPDNQNVPSSEEMHDILGIPPGASVTIEGSTLKY